MQNVVGPTLVAMAAKFGLGAEIQSPTGLSGFTPGSVPNSKLLENVVAVFITGLISFPSPN